MDMKRKQRKNSRERKEEGLVKTRARGILLILALCLSMVGTSVVYAEEAASPPGAYQDEGQDQSQDSEDTDKDTKKEDDSEGYCVHCFNAVHVGHRWIKLDARGNNDRVSVAFSLHDPAIAFVNRPQYNEFFWPGIFANPHRASMNALEAAKNMEELLKALPDHMLEDPDILEVEAEDVRPRSWFW